jgi:hypothetical protein
LSDDDLRAEYGRVLERRVPGSRAGCPSPEAIRALVEREGAEADRLATLDHVMACGECQKDFEMFRAPRETAARLERRSLPSWLAAAAMLALVIGAAWIWKARQVSGGTEITRGGVRSVELVGPAAVAPGASPVFVWRAVATAQRYQLELDTEAGDPVYETSTADTTARLPDSVHLSAGTTYRWWVRATLASGALIRSTALRLELHTP